MINPGYKAQVHEKPFQADAGPMIYCPKCKKPLGEGEVLRFYTRCKHCGRWVLLTKKD